VQLDVEPDRDVDALHVAELLVDTRRQRIQEGWRVCPRCGDLPHPNDMGGVLFPDLCSSCEMIRVDRLLYKIGKRHGRKRALELLKRLAK
jgi:hypothetical protein